MKSIWKMSFEELEDLEQKKREKAEQQTMKFTTQENGDRVATVEECGQTTTFRITKFGDCYRGAKKGYRLTITVESPYVAKRSSEYEYSTLASARRFCEYIA